MPSVRTEVLTRRIIPRSGSELPRAFLPLLMASLLLPAPRAARATSIDTLFIATGEAVGDNLGSAVAAAGDVNGDGYADVIVGARGNDAGGIGAGRAYVYCGGPRAGAAPCLVFTSPSAGIGLGSSVGAAGDVNGDGYSDVIVGADGHAFVYYGGHPADAVPDLVLTQVASFEGFGSSVGTAGDVNGDGYSDVIVGAPGDPCDALGRVCQPGEGLAGSAYLYFGGPSADAVADMTLTGEAKGSHFGASVAAAGDVNGDSYSDVIVGAPNYNGGGAGTGRVYVYYGGPGMDGTADLVLTGVAEGDEFGSSVGAAGDVNGDGYSDVIVGAPRNDAGGGNVGRAYVYYGGSSADGAPDLTLTGEAPSVFFGVSAGTAGDVNGDGYADVIVGSAHFLPGSEKPGRVCVYHGGPGADTVPDLVLTAPADDFFGSSAGTAGDVNGDGFADLIVGAHGSDAGGADAGRAYVFTSTSPVLAVALDLDPDVLSPGAHGRWITAYIESSEFDPGQIDLTTVKLAGIVPVEAKPATLGDEDLNGIPDLMVKFSRETLEPLLAPGLNSLEVTGSLVTGEKFRGTDTVRVVRLPAGKRLASVAPNPLNPIGTLTFRTSALGPVTVRLFDLQGRVLRTIVEMQPLPAGTHEVRINGKDERGQPLATGVYFYAIETVDGPMAGQFTILK